MMLNYSKARPHYNTPTRYPVVLCHGFSGFDQLFMIPAFNPTSYQNFMSPPIIDEFKSWLNGIKGEPKKIDNSIKSVPRGMDVDNMTPLSNSIKSNNSSSDLAAATAETGKYLLEYWNGVREHLQSYKCVVIVAKVPPFATIENRALALDKYIKSQIPKLKKQQRKHKDLKNDNNATPETFKRHEPIKLNLIAHSMGGLDCRFLISKLNENPNPEYQIASLTTISTPHRGTSVADFMLQILPVSVVRQFPSIYQLSTEYSRKFNDVIVDDPKVSYFSYAAQMYPNPLSVFLITWKIIYDKEGNNDGMVSVESSKWGKFMGCLDDVDHADLINWMGIVKKTKLAMGVPNFDAKYFYLDIIDNLANHGL